MLLQIVADLVFNSTFEHHQQKPQLGDDSNFSFSHRDGARYARAFKMNGVTIPAIVNIEFLCQVVGEAIGSPLGFLFFHLMNSVNINGGHYVYHFVPCLRSLDGLPPQGQHRCFGATF